MSGNSLISWEEMGRRLDEIKTAGLDVELIGYILRGAYRYECNIIQPMDNIVNARLVGHGEAADAPDAVWLAYQQARAESLHLFYANSTTG